MSLAIVRLPRAAQMGAIGQVLGLQGQADGVSARVCEVAHPIEKTERLQDSRVDANAHRVVTRLDSPKRRAARESALGNYFRRQASSSSGITDVQPQFAKRSADCQRWAVRSRHDGSFVFLYMRLM
jgi:hypothetical protein